MRLTLSGYQGEQLVFSNATWLNVSRRNFSSSVQTDRALYGPGQKVLIWIAILQLDNRPYRGHMEFVVLVRVLLCVLRRRNTIYMWRS